jgi:ribosomal protein L18
MEKKVARIRRALATRAHIRKLGAVRLSVHRT